MPATFTLGELDYIHSFEIWMLNMVVKAGFDYEFRLLGVSRGTKREINLVFHVKHDGVS